MVVKADGAGYGGFPLGLEGPASAAAVADALAMLSPAGEEGGERLLSILANTLEAMVDATEQREHARLQAKLLQGVDACGPAPQLTVFHGLRAPPISIEAYLLRIAKYVKCSPACFAHGLVHMLKLAGADPSFAPTRLNVHRLLLTGVLISAKFLDDRYYNNAFYAKVGGVSTAELNRLELEMLQLLDFQLSVTPEALVAVLLDAQSGRVVLQMVAAYGGGGCCGLTPCAGLASAGVMQLPCWDGPGSAVHGQHVLAAGGAHCAGLPAALQRKRRSNSLELMDGGECRPRAFHRASMEVVAMAQ
ncbi:CYCU4-1 [Scenedesmus sp. PABB004]|nr:CYCU4-1 [Scenedesmus sp. PABB004]